MANRRQIARQLHLSPPRRQRVLAPVLGVYNDRPHMLMPERAMWECINVRIRNGEITNQQMGYSQYVETVLPDPILHATNFRQRNGSSHLLVCTRRDIARYNSVAARFDYLTPIEDTGTITAIGPLVAGVGTTWITDGVKIGDFIHFNDAAYVNGDGDWYPIVAVVLETQLTISGYTGPLIGPGIAYTIRKTFTAATGDLWDDETFPKAQPANEDTWYATDGREMVKWNGSAAQVTVLALGFVARKLKLYKNMMHYGDLLVGAERRNGSFRNSDVAQPEVTAGGTASELAAVRGTDTLIGWEILGDHLVALAERSVNMLYFDGDPIGYTIRTVLDGIGPVAPRLVVNQGDYLEFIAHDRGYRFDGVSKSEFGSQVLRELLKTTASDRLYQSHAHRVSEEGEIHWVLALGSDAAGTPQRSYVEHYAEPVGSKHPTPFTVRQLPALCMTSWVQSGAQTFDAFALTPALDDFSTQTIGWDDRGLGDQAPITVFGAADGKLYRLDSGETLAGEPLWAGAFFARQTSADGIAKANIRTVEPFIRRRVSSGGVGSSGSLVILISSFDDPMDAQATGAYTRGHFLDKSGNRRVPGRISGRYYELAFLAFGYGSAVPTPSPIFHLAGWEAITVDQGSR